jgi:MEMO1 family protein
MLTKPKLRQNLKASVGEAPNTVVLSDPFHLGGPLLVSRLAFDVMKLFDGEHTMEQIHADFAKLFGAQSQIDVGDTLKNLLAGLDQAFFLDSPRLHERLTLPDRPPSCIGSYEADPEKLRKQLKRNFTAHGGPGLPGTPGCRIASHGPIRAVLVPHMDYGRGGATYGWGFKELFERTDAVVFVVVATSHYSLKRFSLTRQNFPSPFGKVETDRAYVDRIVSHYGDGLFDDPFAHVAEHSIELEVVMLQYLFENVRPFRIVPLLVGSFFDRVETKESPGRADDVARMIRALQMAEAESNAKVCYIISGDLAHIGPKHGDEDLVDEAMLKHGKTKDEELLKHLENLDSEAYFQSIAAEEDGRRICGLPPTYVAMAAARPIKCVPLHYGRYVHPDGFESVSFASAALTG